MLLDNPPPYRTPHNLMSLPHASPLPDYAHTTMSGAHTDRDDVLTPAQRSFNTAARKGPPTANTTRKAGGRISQSRRLSELSVRWHVGELESRGARIPQIAFSAGHTASG